MVTTAAEPLFLDTNVLVYASMAALPLHAVARGAIESIEALADCMESRESPEGGSHDRATR